MQTLDRTVVIQTLEQAGLDEDAIYDSYTGRDNKTGFGIRVGQDERDGFALFATMGESDEFDDMLTEKLEQDLSVADFAERARVENLGRGLIIFFPGFELG